MARARFCACYSLPALLGLGALFFGRGATALAGVCVVLAGALFAFLFFNRPPAVLFMGDGGSLVLGLLSGGLTLLALRYSPAALLFFALPLFDGVRCAVARIADGKSPFCADRRHLHFRLSDGGASPARLDFSYLGMGAGLSALALLSDAFFRKAPFS